MFIKLGLVYSLVCVKTEYLALPWLWLENSLWKNSFSVWLGLSLNA